MGIDDDSGGCGRCESSCDGMVSVRLTVAASDDVSSAEQLGYLVKPVGKAPTPGTAEGPARARDGEVWLGWGDQDAGDDVSFDVDVFTVDRAGNVSEQATRVHVGSEGGCSASSRSPHSEWLAVPLVLFLQRRRATRSPRR